MLLTLVLSKDFGHQTTAVKAPVLKVVDDAVLSGGERGRERTADVFVL